MCGIAGLLTNKDYGIDASLLVSEMIERLDHRGPDGNGKWADDKDRVVFGHSRLSIIDLSDNGAQPMRSNCGNLLITYNGEIYNYLELRDELESQGHTFKGYSDTEVFLNAISCWGLDKALHKAVGMFAFALWDKRKKHMYLVRDRAGKKPLYFSQREGTLRFASEIKALKNTNEFPLSINYEALSHYLSLGYIPSPLTIYREIEEVLPGHVFTWDQDLTRQEYAYWTLPTYEDSKIPFDDAVQESGELLRDAVRMRMRADVPVGIFLSGGIDSGLLTAFAANATNRPLQTYTVGFGESNEHDETRLARQVAQRYATEHHEIRLNPNLEDLVPKVAAAYDEPFGDASAVPTYAVAEAASKELKVVLNGEGSDELFAGYRRHLAVKYASYFDPIFRRLPKALVSKLQNSLPFPEKSRTSYGLLYRFLQGIGKDSVESFIPWTADTYTDNEKNKIFKRELFTEETTTEWLRKVRENKNDPSPLSHFMALDFLTGMADSLLVKMDIATMAHSLEARSPFLDHRVVEFAARLDRRILLPSWSTKPLLRKLARQYLPNEVVIAPKRGFEPPVLKWMKNDLFNMANDLFRMPNGIVQTIMDRKAIEQLMSPDSGVDEARRAKRQWILLMLALWDSEN